ncbi:nucleoid occlusion protein [Azotosporobacter soli]|uniref:nucleoid occlusion protein n=1 Tax=Azotosporobacter soli TaxID=3055040 RepID=UPI0031FE9AF8
MKRWARLLGIGGTEGAEATNLSPAEMTLTEKDGAPDSQLVEIETINANPFQPRKTFSEEALAELSASIREYGILQPLIVRRREQGYELVAGERRLRASLLAGLTEVPVLIRDFDDKEMAELAMIENLQREDLHYLEEAEGYQSLLQHFSLTQEELAKRMGKKQSTIANKLRILKLSAPVRTILAREGLTERHARALLKLEDDNLQQEVLDLICQRGLNVRASEELIEEFLEDIASQVEEKKAPKRQMVKMVRDVRIFLNTINTVVGEMKKTGFKVKVKQEQDEEYIHINLKIPKTGKK